jgi:hypothetical protein
LILPDSSAWIEYLRRTESAADLGLDRLIRGDAALATTEPVAMEVLAGARSAAELRDLRRMLGRAEFLPVEGLADYEAAAEIYRACRDAEKRPRSMLDCLIAAVAIRTAVPLLHRDADFELIARHTELRTETG